MREHSGLLTDLYELTMAAGYLQTGFDARATFELFVRNLPPHRNFLVAAGLEQALEFLEHVNFNADEIAYLRSHHVFSYIGPEFFEYLRTFHFTGDVWAVPEGTLVFPGEPMLRVSAPIIEAQIMETYLLATLGYQTMIASKTARVVTAAQGRRVVEFGARRAHSAQAGLFAARAAAIGGSVGTSNVLAGQQYGIYTYGTQAHSWVMAHDDEADAFAHFLDAFPERAFLLLDTYNVHDAVEKITRMGRKPAGVRLDSGDIAKDTKWVRRELDKAGWQDVKIFASGDLDEEKIAELLAKGAAIDSFGVGSALATPSDAPLLNLVYKLVEVDRAGKIQGAAKLTQAKVTYPGRKQVFRYSNRAGQFEHDRIALDDEAANGGRPLLVQVMRAGRRISAPESIDTLHNRCVDELAHLPERYRRIDRSAEYPVKYSKALEKLLEKVRQRVRHSASNSARAGKGR
ncbi:MAG TPA: nicotinate phosphoribosyltransferase [Terriglobales bacterium]|jgi:nicotinate phosphoribosyltransferase|nr:nicotinate phosphoribosyltransferase [Terriglobales bacterium]